MIEPQVLVVLTNYRRPGNITKIAVAFREQSVPVRLVLVDNSGGCEPPADEYFDDIWKFDENHGPPCRFAPALLHHDLPYILFYDDDMLPGCRAVEHLLATAGSLKDWFATIGEIGRSIGGGPDGLAYIRRNVTRFNSPRRVDITCRAHFVRTSLLHNLLRLKWLLLRWGKSSGHSPEYVRELVGRHDDILLCLGLRLYACEITEAGQRRSSPCCYLSPEGPPETRLRLHDLPDGGCGVSARPDHNQERTDLIRMAYRLAGAGGA